MKKNSKDILKEVEDFFVAPPTPNQKAWGLINDFYNLALTYMKEKEPKEITKAELARRLGKSRSAITQMFNKTPNLTIKKMVEISNAIGFDINLYSNDIQPREKEIKYVYIIHHKNADDWVDDISLDTLLSKKDEIAFENPDNTNSFFRGFYGN